MRVFSVPTPIFGQKQREGMADGIWRARAFVLSELQSRAREQNGGDSDDEDRCRFGEVPPAPKRDIVQGDQINRNASVLRWVVDRFCLLARISATVRSV